MTASSSPRVQALLQLLFSEAGNGVYAILDAARSPNLYRWISQCGLRAQSLYSGTSAITLAEQAPYLIQLDANNPKIDYLLEAGWGRSLGIFVQGTTDFSGMRIQMKKKLVVRDQDGRRLYFRFYDPRVARAFLTTADTQGLRWWFESDLQRCIVESAEGDAIIVDRGIVSNGKHAAHRQRIPASVMPGTQP